MLSRRRYGAQEDQHGEGGHHGQRAAQAARAQGRQPRLGRDGGGEGQHRPPASPPDSSFSNVLVNVNGQLTRDDWRWLLCRRSRDVGNKLSVSDREEFCMNEVSSTWSLI